MQGFPEAHGPCHLFIQRDALGVAFFRVWRNFRPPRAIFELELVSNPVD